VQILHNPRTTNLYWVCRVRQEWIAGLQRPVVRASYIDAIGIAPSNGDAFVQAGILFGS
jgi:hypothetical protein